MVKVPLSARRNNERPVLPDGSSVFIRKTSDGLGIYNPARRKPFLLLFLIVWLFMWSMGFRFGVVTVLGGGVAGFFVAIIWLPVWGIIGISVSLLLGWYAFGWERIFITDGVFVHSKGVGPLKRMKAYLVSELSDFRIDPRKSTANDGFLIAALEYQVRGVTRRFGVEMSTQEANAVLAAIKRYVN